MAVFQVIRAHYVKTTHVFPCHSPFLFIDSLSDIGAMHGTSQLDVGSLYGHECVYMCDLIYA